MVIVGQTCPTSTNTYENKIIIENKKIGTSNWKLTNPVSAGSLNNGLYGDINRTDFTTPVLEGYAWPQSLGIGETVSLYINTESSTVDIKIYRMGYYQGYGGRYMNKTWSINGSTQNNYARYDTSNRVYYDGRNWIPSITFDIPTDWISGIYLAKLTTGTDKDNKQSYIPFVIREDTRASQYIVQFSWTNWHAYNGWGSSANYNYLTSYNQRYETSEYPGNDYFESPDGNIKFLPISNLKRPFLTSACQQCAAGTGAGQLFAHDKGPNGHLSYQNQDPSTQSATGSCAGWEYNALVWLEENGYDVTYMTNLDTDNNQLSLANHAAFISLGHDEYYSVPAFLNVKNAIDRGMSFIFLSGNTAWNAIDIIKNNGILTGDIWVPSNFSPKNSIVGTPLKLTNSSHTDYSLIGSTWDGGGATYGPITINSNTPTWLLKDIDSCVTQIGYGLAGYETNGGGDAAGLTTSEQQSYSYQIPSDMIKPFSLGMGPNSYSILYNSKKSLSFVFSANTINWAWGLNSYSVDTNCNDCINPSANLRPLYVDTNIQKITANLLQKSVEIPTGIPYTIKNLCAGPSYNLSFTSSDSSPELSTNPYDWLLNKYTGSRSCVNTHISEPYHGESGYASDTWFTIDSSSGNGRLIVTNNGISDSPVVVYGDSNGQWGQTNYNTQQYWRLIPYTKPTNFNLSNSKFSIFLIQSVSNGQLLIVGGCSSSNNYPGSVIVYGDSTGWGEEEYNTQKMWAFVN